VNDVADAPIRILLIEDNPGDARLIREMLADAAEAGQAKPAFDLAWADRISTGLRHLDARQTDAVLLDLSLPDSHGLDTFIRVRAHAPWAPTIVLSGLDDASLAVEAVREGAQDYLVKGQVDGNLLVRSIRYAIERKRAEIELRAQKQLFENLVAVARATAERPTLEATLQNALDVAATLTGAEQGDLFLVSEAGVVTYSAWTGGTVTEQRPDSIVCVMDHGLVGWSARHRRAALIADTTQDTRWLPLPGRSSAVRSALCVPILSGSTLLGILALAHSQPGHFTDKHLQLMLAAVDQMALAVRNAQIFDAQRRTAERETTLYQVLRAVSGQLDPEAVIHAAVEVIARLTCWSHVIIALPQDPQCWMVHAASGILSTAVGVTFPIGQGVVGRAFRTTQTQLMPDVRTDPDYIPWHPAIRSELAVPLQRGGRTLGVLDLESDCPAAFDADDVRWVESLAEAVALAMDNARLYAEVRRHATDLSALYAIARTTSRSLALEDVLSQALSSALVSFGFEAGLISLVDSESGGGQGEPSLRLVAQRGLPPACLERFQRDGPERALCDYVHRQRENLVIGNFERDTPETLHERMAQLVALGWRGYVGIPLQHQEQSLGVLGLFTHRPRDSSPYDLALLTGIGHQVATAVANARLFQTTLYERSRLQALIKSSRDGVVLVGMNGHILVVNLPALQMLRLPGQPEDWLGRDVKDALRALRILAPAIVRVMFAEMRRIRKGDEPPAEGECEVAPRVIHWLNLPVLAGVTSLGRLLVLRDVTAERAAERLREDMTHTMVHDLRNPLASISSALEFLDEESSHILSAEQRQILEIAQDGTHKTLGLVNRILDVSRLESGQMPLNRARVELDVLIAETLRSQSPLAIDKGLCLESDVPSTLPPAWADAELVGRVLQNLIGNAIKFTPTGGRVSVAARCEEQAQHTKLCVCVSDTGPGIPLEVQGRLFQKFVTGQQAERGSGLGLAFCKLAVEAHGERIWVESVPGCGTTFTFSLQVDPDAYPSDTL